MTQQLKLDFYFQRGSLLCGAVSVGHSKKTGPLSSLCNYDGTRAVDRVWYSIKKFAFFHTLGCSVLGFYAGISLWGHSRRPCFQKELVATADSSGLGFGNAIVFPCCLGYWLYFKTDVFRPLWESQKNFAEITKNSYQLPVSHPQLLPLSATLTDSGASSTKEEVTVLLVRAQRLQSGLEFALGVCSVGFDNVLRHIFTLKSSYDIHTVWGLWPETSNATDGCRQNQRLKKDIYWGEELWVCSKHMEKRTLPRAGRASGSQKFQSLFEGLFFFFFLH